MCYGSATICQSGFGFLGAYCLAFLADMNASFACESFSCSSEAHALDSRRPDDSSCRNDFTTLLNAHRAPNYITLLYIVRRVLKSEARRAEAHAPNLSDNGEIIFLSLTGMDVFFV